MDENKGCIIYNRTSTEEQNPENQLKDCLGLARKLLVKEYELYEEKASAWKDDLERDKFQEIIKLIKKGQVGILIVWDLDRIYRNRKKLIAFFSLCKLHECKVYAYRQDWLSNMNKMPAPWNEIVFDLMLQIMGWIAEEESSKKSERVRAAIRIKDGKTYSYKGNVWGRKEVPKKTIMQILELYTQGKKYREITKEVFYWDSNNHKKNVSLGFVHKVIKNSKLEEDSKSDSSLLTN